MKFNKKIVCSTGEEVIGYDSYLNTKHWKAFREQMKTELAYECFQCKGISESLHLHHKTYKRIGNESNKDVMWLCDKCHKILHNRMNDAKKERKKQNKVIQKKFKENTDIAKKIRDEMKLMDKSQLESLLNHARGINGKNYPRPRKVK